MNGSRYRWSLSGSAVAILSTRNMTFAAQPVHAPREVARAFTLCGKELKSFWMGKKSKFAVIPRLIFSVMLLTLGACSDDDTNTKATTKQTENSSSVTRTHKVQVLDKSSIEFEDVSAEEFTRQLTAHIKKTKGLSWITFQPTDSDQKEAEQAAMAWAIDNGVKEGWDPEKKRFVSIEGSRSELGCLLMALVTTTEPMIIRARERSGANITVGSNKVAGAEAEKRRRDLEKLKNSGNATRSASAKFGGIEIKDWLNHTLTTTSADGAMIVEGRTAGVVLSLTGQPGRAVYSSETELHTLNTNKTIERQISHRIDGKEVNNSTACVFIFEPSQ